MIIEDVSGGAQGSMPILLSQSHVTGPQPQVMVWGAFSFDNRTPLVVIRGKLQHSNNARPHTARVAMNSLTACQALPWPARFLSNRAYLGYDGKVTVSTREC
ncbi:hypothetical protein TNCV_431461 [Trichonephila clavipes]|nr:hypothetical protein TNCV_431461 [Trichonephila clavipes]